MGRCLTAALAARPPGAKKPRSGLVTPIGTLSTRSIVRRPQELLELGVPPDPDLRAEARWRRDDRRRGGGRARREPAPGRGAAGRRVRSPRPAGLSSWGRPFGNAWVRVYTAASVCSNAPVSPWPGPSSDSCASSAATFPAGCCSSPTSSW